MWEKVKFSLFLIGLEQLDAYFRGNKICNQFVDQNFWHLHYFQTRPGLSYIYEKKAVNSIYSLWKRKTANFSYTEMWCNLRNNLFEHLSSINNAFIEPLIWLDSSRFHKQRESKHSNHMHKRLCTRQYPRFRCEKIESSQSINK